MTYPHNDPNNRDSRNDRGPSNGHPTSRYDDRGGSSRGGYPDDRGSGQAAAPPRDRAAQLTPKGEYPVQALVHKWGYTTNNHEQIGIRLRILEGEHKGTTLLWYGNFHDNSKDITMRALRSLGFRGNDLSDMSGIYDKEAKAVAVVDHEVSQKDGKTYAKVQWINGADVAMKEEMNDRELAAFAQRMRGELARVGGAAAPSSAQPDDRRPPPRDDRRDAPPPDTRQQFGRGGVHDPPRDAPPPSDGDAPPWGGRTGRG